jgi:hypothetical protein
MNTINLSKIRCDIAGECSETRLEAIHQRNFESTKNNRRSENGFLGTFGEGSFKSGRGVKVTDSWEVE